MITRRPPAKPVGPCLGISQKVTPGTPSRSIHALSEEGMVKLYIGAPITTMSVARNWSSTARSAGKATFMSLGVRFGRRRIAPVVTVVEMGQGHGAEIEHRHFGVRVLALEMRDDRSGQARG